MATLRVDPEFLAQVLHLPAVRIVGAEMIGDPRFGGSGPLVIALEVEGPDVPVGAKEVRAIFTQICKLEDAT